jgi:hypothetical protein
MLLEVIILFLAPKKFNEINKEQILGIPLRKRTVSVNEQ